MNFPEETDYIDIHTHGAESVPGLFSIDTLMAHEERLPSNIKGVAYTFGIHPWYLDEENQDELTECVRREAGNENVAAIGEAGFDKLKGPPLDLQRKIFEEQVYIAEDHLKPVVIHCVRAWDELLMAQKKIRPKTPWLVHGFRGNKELANQLILKGMYISFWFDFVLRPESSELIKSLPPERFFLETDGAEADIRNIYNKVSHDLGMSVDELKSRIRSNFHQFFIMTDSQPRT
jgi:TatD DNase family protein